MKNLYISPELEVFEVKCDSIMGNFFSNPETDKVDDDPTTVITIPLDPREEEEEEEDVVVTSKHGGFFSW